MVPPRAADPRIPQVEDRRVRQTAKEISVERFQPRQIVSSVEEDKLAGSCADRWLSATNLVNIAKRFPDSQDYRTATLVQKDKFSFTVMETFQRLLFATKGLLSRLVKVRVVLDGHQIKIRQIDLCHSMSPLGAPDSIEMFSIGCVMTMTFEINKEHHLVFK
jgi:hypothetical protein